jgi:hypothetical protein
MDSYAVRAPCERPFLNRGIGNPYQKLVYGAENAAAIMVSVSVSVGARQNGTSYLVILQY